MTEFQVVFVTHPDLEKARELAGELVSKKLVACVNIVPRVISVYSWQGKIENDDEVLMIMKTSADRRDALEAAVSQAHPYTVPEILSLPVCAGNHPYLAWLTENTRP